MAINNKEAYEELPQFLKRAIEQEIKRATEVELEEAKKRIMKASS